MRTVEVVCIPAPACSHTIANLNNSNHAFSRTIPILTLVLEPVIVAGHDKRHFRGGNSFSRTSCNMLYWNHCG